MNVKIPATVINYGTHQQLSLCPLSIEEALEQVGVEPRQISKANAFTLQGEAGWELTLGDSHSVWSTHPSKEFPWEKVAQLEEVTLQITGIVPFSGRFTKKKRKVRKSGGETI